MKLVVVMEVFHKVMVSRLSGPLVRFVMVIVPLYFIRSCAQGEQSQDMMGDMIYSQLIMEVTVSKRDRDAESSDIKKTNTLLVSRMTEELHINS